VLSPKATAVVASAVTNLAPFRRQRRALDQECAPSTLRMFYEDTSRVTMLPWMLYVNVRATSLNILRWPPDPDARV